MSEIQQTADYIGIIAKGELKYSGRVEEGENLEELFLEIAAKGGEDR